eukprot:6668069-Alexandrium_andersonii.AAC.1
MSSSHRNGSGSKGHPPSAARPRARLGWGAGAPRARDRRGEAPAGLFRDNRLATGCACLGDPWACWGYNGSAWPVCPGAIANRCRPDYATSEHELALYGK